MAKEYIDKLKQKREAAAAKAQEDERAGKIVSAVETSGKSSQNEFTTAIHDLMLATLVGKDPQIIQVTKDLAKLLKEIGSASDKFEASALKDIPKVQQKIVDALQAIPETIAEAAKQPDLTPHLDAIVKAVQGKNTTAQVNVAAPNLDPILKAIQGIKFPTPEKGEKADFSSLESSVESVREAIQALRFPVANYVLPFKDASGKDAQVTLDADGKVPTSGGGGSSGTQYAELVTTAPGTGTLALGRYKLAAPTLTDGQMYGVQLDASGNLKVAGSFSSTPPSDIAPATQNITVVDSSSSSAAGANGQTVVIGTPTVGSAASFALATIETVRVMVTGIWTGTITAEQSLDGGTTWTTIGIHQGAYTVSSFTAGFVGGANIAGATNFRMRATATITGTAVVKVIESLNTQSVYIANAAPSGNVVSILNSTAVTLGANAVYTGTSEDVANFSEMRVTVFSNVASATDGLSIQQSIDNSNWDVTDVYTVAASTSGQGKTFIAARQARYFRVVYTNGGTIQASFRLSSILNRTATTGSSQRASDGYTNETDLEQVQGFNMGFNGTTWDRLRTVGTGVLSTSAILTAGSALIGKVGIDQTTLGTTNNVSVSGSTGAGTSALIKDDTAFGDGVTTGIASAAPRLYNGTNYDRARGDAANGMDVDVTRLPALVAGTALIGKVGIDQTTPGTTNLVAVSSISTSVTPGTAAANLGKAEDAAHASGDTGVFALGVRNDNLATTYGADQDYSPLATDLKGRVMVAQKAATGTLSNVAASATSVTVLAANASRIGATISNDSSAVVYLKFGATASTTSYTVSLAGAASAPFSYYEVPAGYTGIIDGIWASATGNARVTEIT